VRKVIALDPANHGNRITLAGLYWGAKQPEKARGPERAAGGQA
jgi:hypothetical protein